jgi:hypothetical protein
VLKGGKRVARLTGHAKLGRNSLVWKGKVHGRPVAAEKYTLKLHLRSGDGQTADERGKLTITP